MLPLRPLSGCEPIWAANQAGPPHSLGALGGAVPAGGRVGRPAVGVKDRAEERYRYWFHIQKPRSKGKYRYEFRLREEFLTGRCLALLMRDAAICSLTGPQAAAWMIYRQIPWYNGLAMLVMRESGTMYHWDRSARMISEECTTVGGTVFSSTLRHHLNASAPSQFGPKNPPLASVLAAHRPSSKSLKGLL